MPTTDRAYFVRLEPGSGRFRATEHTAGAWSVSEQHIAPTLGLLAHEIECRLPGDGKQLARISMDILGVLAVDEVEVDVEVVRGGRTIELVEARVHQGGRTAVRARAWRLLPTDTAAVAGGPARPMPRPDELPAWDMGSVWPGGYIAGIVVRREPEAAPGRAVAWVRTPVDLVADEEPSDVARWLAVVDTANGLSVRESPEEWLFPNVDLTVHLHRSPRGPWVGFDTDVTFGSDGLGLTETVLHDETGPVGRAAQVLTVRHRPSR